jgi:soluble lytic murein transglycosylase-like protein
MAARTPLLTLLAGALLLAGRVACADIFAFTDDHGIVHYTNVPNDTRYRIVLAAPRTGDLAASVPVGQGVLQKSERYAPLIEAAARASSIEPALVKAVMVAESGGDPKALSRRGARGLMQLMPDTARRYGVRDVFDPEQNIKAGSQYLRDLSDRYRNDLELVLAAYNAGPSAVDGHGGRIPPLRETLDYVPRVLRIYQRLHDVTRAQ